MMLSNVYCFKLFSRLVAFIVIAFSGNLAAQVSAEETLLAESSPTGTAKIQSFNIEEKVKVNLESFDQVWKTVKEVHWDQSRVGSLWDEAGGKYRPLAEKAKSTKETRVILNNMLSELGLSHYGIIPKLSSDAVKPDDKVPSGENVDIKGYSGLDFRATDDGVVVSRVREGSYAQKAGVKAGWVVERIGNQSIKEVVDRFNGVSHGPMRHETMIGLTIMPKLSSGKMNSRKMFVFRDELLKKYEVELILQAPPGVKTTFGNITQEVHTIKKSLSGDIGYYYFSDFLDPVRVMNEFREFVRDENHSQGLVIDLRGNPGGIAAMAMGMAAEFSSKNSDLGAMISKSEKLKFFITKNYNPVICPVAILIDECSASTSEIFSSGMQDLGLARVFGRRSAGLALPSVIVTLPNGDNFQYAVANYLSASGKALEGQGVMPDEIVTLSPELLRKDPDPVLTKALHWIKKQNQ